MTDRNPSGGRKATAAILRATRDEFLESMAGGSGSAPGGNDARIILAAERSLAEPAGDLTLLSDRGSPGILVQPARGPIELQFSEDIRLGAGQIELLVFNGTEFVVRETFDLDSANGAVSVTGDTLSVRPSDALEILTEHALRIGSDTIRGVSGSPFSPPPGTPGIRFISSAGVDLPSIDLDDYDTVIFGQTFHSTLKLDRGDDNILLINSVFENIDGSGLELRNLSNVTIYDCSFINISGTAIRLRSSGSTNNVSIISNRFDRIGRNAVSASKRYKAGVDHTNLKIVDNDIGDTGYDSDRLAHAIYVQTSGTYISGNSIVGTTDANAISIRGDGIVWDNYINVRSMDPYGSGIKYYADHMTGDSKRLIIADNHVAGVGLYSGIEIKANPKSIPSGIAPGDWTVNHFRLARNTFDEVRNEYVIDRRIGNAHWSSVEVLNWSSMPHREDMEPGRRKTRFIKVMRDPNAVAPVSEGTGMEPASDF